MIEVDKLKRVFYDKLKKTGSMDAAFTKALWIAYQQGLADAPKPVAQVAQVEEVSRGE